MALTAPVREDAQPADEVEEAAPLQPVDARRPLLLYVVLLIGLPSGLVLGPLGAAGSPASVLGMVFLLWWVNARLVPRLGVSRSWHPIRPAIYAFALAGLTAYFVATVRPVSAEEASSADRGLLTLAAWCGVVLVTADGLVTRASLDRLLRMVVAGGVFLAGAGLVEFYTGFNVASLMHIPGLSMNTPTVSSFERDNFRRVQGTAAHAIEFGVVLSMILPLALHYAWYAKTRRKLRWAGVAMIGFALPLTVSRSAILGLFVVLTVMVLTWPNRRRKYVFYAAPFFVVGLQVVSPGLIHAIKGLFFNFSSDPSTQGRTDDFAAVAYYVQRYPVLGRGLSTFIPEIYRTLDNAFLGWTIEAGVVGLAALVILQLTGVLSAFRVRASFPDERSRDLAASLGAGLLACSLNFGTFDALGFAMNAGLFFLYLGMIGAMWRLAHGSVPPRPETTRERWRRLLTPQARHRLTFQVALGFTAAVLTLTPGFLRTEYTATGALLLQGPAQKSGGINPFFNAPYLDLPSEVLQRLVMAQSTQARMRAEGHEGTYTVAAGIGSLAPRTDRLGTGPLIRVQAVAATQAEALETRDAVIVEMQRLMVKTQHDVGSVPSEYIIATNVSPPDLASPRHGNRPRSFVAGGMLGFLAGGVIWSLRNRYTRSHFVARHAATPATAPPDPGRY